MADKTLVKDEHEADDRYVCKSFGCPGTVRDLSQVRDFDNVPYAWVCTKCGLESDLSPATTSQIDFEYRDVSVISERPSTYHRKSHIIERLSSHLGNDPLVPDDDYDIIQREYHNNPYPDLRFASEQSQREIIHSMLGAIDARLKSKPGFTNRYLEKSKQLTMRLTGEWIVVNNQMKRNHAVAPVTKTLSDEEVALVGATMVFYSDEWDACKRLDPPMFPERKHFPSFNLTFRHIFKRHRLTHKVDLSEFPLPTRSSVKKLKKIIRYFDKQAFSKGFYKKFKKK